MDEPFIVNVAEARALSHTRAGTYVPFEPPDERFPEFGINIHVLEPGEPNGKYHSENAQEDFLVLFGECRLILEGVERPLRAWDFVHCPAGTEHIFVGAGEGPCAILMVGARPDDEELDYPPNEIAARYGASVAERTASSREAYADWSSELTETRLDWPPRAVS
jgi:uncharacterized cupin superfamily protein